MKKCIISAFLYLLILCIGGICGFAENDTGEFDDESVIVVMKPAASRINFYSLNPSLEELGISSVKKLSGDTAGDISFFSLSAEEQVLRLTLSEPGEENVLKTIDKLNELPDVAYAEPNYIYHLSDTPNDTYYKSGNQYALDKINAMSVWEMDIDCSNIAVAVLDSGVMINHPDLRDNIWTNTGEIPNNGIDTGCEE